MYGVTSKDVIGRCVDKLDSLQVPPIVGSLHTVGIIPESVKSHINSTPFPWCKRQVLLEYLQGQPVELLERFCHHLKETSTPLQAATPAHTRIADGILMHMHTSASRKRSPPVVTDGLWDGSVGRHYGGDMEQDGHLNTSISQSSCHSNGNQYFYGYLPPTAPYCDQLSGSHSSKDEMEACYFPPAHNHITISNGITSQEPHHSPPMEAYPQEGCYNPLDKCCNPLDECCNPLDECCNPPQKCHCPIEDCCSPPSKKLKLCPTNDFGLDSEPDSGTVYLAAYCSRKEPVQKGKFPHIEITEPVHSGKSHCIEVTEPNQLGKSLPIDTLHRKRKSASEVVTPIESHPSPHPKADTTDHNRFPILASSQPSSHLLSDQALLHPNHSNACCLDDESNSVTKEMYMLVGQAVCMCEQQREASDIVSSLVEKCGGLIHTHTSHTSSSPVTSTSHNEHVLSSPSASLLLPKVRPTRVITHRKTRLFALKMRQLRTTSTGEAMNMANRLLANKTLPLDFKLTGIQAVLPSSVDAIPILKRCLRWTDSSDCQNPLFHKCSLHYRLVWCYKRCVEMDTAREHADIGVHYGRQIEGDIGPIQAESYSARLGYHVNKDHLTEEKLQELEAQHERALSMSWDSSQQESLVRTILEVAMIKMRMADYYVSQGDRVAGDAKLEQARHILDNMGRARTHFEHADWAYYHQIRCHGYIISDDKDKALQFGNKSIRYHTKCGRHGDAKEVRMLLNNHSIHDQSS